MVEQVICPKCHGRMYHIAKRWVCARCPHGWPWGA